MILSPKIILITGGARSGKSNFAQNLARKFSGPKAYLATAQALDEEMARRIRLHQKSRPQNWHTLEEPRQLVDSLKKNGDRFHLILLDCLTLWISNLMMRKWSEKKILAEAERLLKAGRAMKGSLIIVSNEVGMGIVPDNLSARSFRDLTGLIHQKIAKEADEVYFMVSGLPLKIKGV